MGESVSLRPLPIHWIVVDDDVLSMELNGAYAVRSSKDDEARRDGPRRGSGCACEIRVESCARPREGSGSADAACA